MQPFTPDTPCLLITTADRFLGRSLRHSFEDDGYQVEVAEGRDRALACLQARSFHVAVFDADSTPAGGLALFRQARQRGFTAPTVLIVPNGEPDIVIEGFRLGADDCIRKPFSVQELKARVRAVLQRTYRRRSPRAPRRNGNQLSAGL